MSRITEPIKNWHAEANPKRDRMGTPLIRIEYRVYRVAAGESADERLWSEHATEIGAVMAANTYHRLTGEPCYGAVFALDWLGMQRIEPQYACGIALSAIRHA